MIEQPTNEKIVYAIPLFGNIFSISVDWVDRKIEINGVEIKFIV